MNDGAMGAKDRWIAPLAYCSGEAIVHWPIGVSGNEEPASALVSESCLRTKYTKAFKILRNQSGKRGKVPSGSNEII